MESVLNYMVTRKGKHDNKHIIYEKFIFSNFSEKELAKPESEPLHFSKKETYTGKFGGRKEEIAISRSK